MTLAELAGWTPRRVLIDAAGARVEWIDLAGIPFREPFLLETIAGALAGGRATASSPLAALHLLDRDAPGRDPDGLIFHFGRCGSTLVSRAIGEVAGTLVVSEPDAVNDLLELEIGDGDEAALVELLRLVIRALGRVRPERGGPYVVKLSSFAICRAALFRAAFPALPWVFVYRDPREVLGAVLEQPPGWAQLVTRPRVAARLLRVPDASMEAPEAFLVGALAGLLEAARERAGELLLVDYRELPGAIPARILPHLGIRADEADLARIAEAARYDVKAGAARRPFVADSARKRDRVPAGMAAMCAERLTPLYRALEARRAGA